MTKTKQEIAVIDAPQSNVTVMSYYDKLIEVGFETNADLDRMERLFDLKQKHEANEARKAFHLAMAEFKKVPIHIPKTKFNKQYNSYYVDIGVLVNKVAPELGKNGLSHKWIIDQTNGIKVICVATHSLGFSDSVEMAGPNDKSGAKNPLQEMKSTITYLKAVTFESIFGLASSDANLPDDGNGSAPTPVKYINEKQLGTITDMLLAIDKSVKDFCIYKKINSLEEIPASDYMNCVSVLKPEAKK